MRVLATGALLAFAASTFASRFDFEVISGAEDANELTGPIPPPDKSTKWPKYQSLTPTYGRQFVIAHRGLHLKGDLAPENSLDAYAYAARAGYVMAETDIQQTKDGVLVLLHDSTINRTMRHKHDYSEIVDPIKIGDITYEELVNNYVLAAKNPRHRRPLPLMRDWLLQLKQQGVVPMVEVKNTDGESPYVTAVADLAVSIMGQQNVVFCSFRRDHMDMIRWRYPAVELYYIQPYKDDLLKTLAERRPAYWYANARELTPERIEEAKRLGVGVAAWTVNSAFQQAVLDGGVDAIATDDVAPALAPGALGQPGDVVHADGFEGVALAAHGMPGVFHNGTISTDDARLHLKGSSVASMTSAAPAVPSLLSGAYVDVTYAGTGRVTWTDANTHAVIGSAVLEPKSRLGSASVSVMALNATQVTATISPLTPLNSLTIHDADLVIRRF